VPLWTLRVQRNTFKKGKHALIIHIYIDIGVRGLLSSENGNLIKDLGYRYFLYSRVVYTTSMYVNIYIHNKHRINMR
jgi:hypothetical protein